MPRAVQYRTFGGIDVLEVNDVPRPTPGPGEVLVRVVATGINPGEAAIRTTPAPRRPSSSWWRPRT